MRTKCKFCRVTDGRGELHGKVGGWFIIRYKADYKVLTSCIGYFGLNTNLWLISMTANEY